MLRRQKEIRSRVQMVLDASLFGLALSLAHWVRSRWQFEVFGGSREIQPFDVYLWLFAVVVPGAPLVLHLVGFYSRPLIASRRRTAWQLLKGCVYATVGTILVIFVVRRGSSIGRSVIILFGLFSFVLVYLKEEVLQQWRRSQLGQSQIRKRLILVGTSDDIARLRGDWLKAHSDSFEIVAQVNINEKPIENLVGLMHEHSASAVVLTAKHTYLGQVEQTIEVCEREGVEVWLVADFFKTQISRTTVDDIYGRPLLVFRSGPEGSWAAVVKQAIDFCGSVVLLALFSLPMFLVALLIKLTSPGPVLFRQERSGLNGRPFTMLKFRTMATDAEQRKQELAVFNEMTGPVFKLTNDPRITPLGRLLRRYSIDEWPQFLNILRGEMSLVGPRPLPVDETRRFDDYAHRRRLSVKPGLTCLWQISGRNNVTDFNEWVRLDLEYIDNWSLWLDLRILLQTIPAVFTAAGAK